MSLTDIYTTVHSMAAQQTQ